MPPTENNLLKDLLSRITILWITQRNMVIMTVAGFLIILAAIILSLFGNHAKTAQNTSPTNSNTLDPPSQKQNVSNNTYPAPSVFFDSYINKSTIPAEYSKLVKNNGINVYSFKSNFSASEVQELAKSLGVTVDTLNFNKISGSFHYQSQVEQEVKNTALNFLSRLKIGNTTLSDPSLTCNITYKRQDLPGVTFTECHRNWEEIGLPIYNFIGILNVSENTKLSSLKLGSVDSLSPEDKTVTQVTMDGVKVPSADGKMRPDDFNTATVAINNTDGRILSVSSNLRWIESQKTESLSNLLTPEQALKQFMDHKSDLSLTIPSGSGTIDWGKVYQNNQAHGKEAVITEHLLSYLENPPSVEQSFLTPMYTIRGYTTLDTGFRVNFIQTVAALKSAVLGASTQNPKLIAENSDSIQLGVYNPPSPTPTPTTQPNNTSSQSYTDPSGSKKPAPGRYYVYTCPPNVQLESDIDYSAAQGNQYYLASWKMPLDDQGLPPDDFKGCRFTSASSPSVFIYPLRKTSISISTSLATTYADPLSTGNSWSGTIYPSGIFIPTNSNIPYDYL